MLKILINLRKKLKDTEKKVETEKVETKEEEIDLNTLTEPQR